MLPCKIWANFILFGVKLLATCAVLANSELADTCVDEQDGPALLCYQSFHDVVSYCENINCTSAAPTEDEQQLMLRVASRTVRWLTHGVEDNSVLDCVLPTAEQLPQCNSHSNRFCEEKVNCFKALHSVNLHGECLTHWSQASADCKNAIKEYQHQLKQERHGRIQQQLANTCECVKIWTKDRLDTCSSGAIALSSEADCSRIVQGAPPKENHKRNRRQAAPPTPPPPPPPILPYVTATRLTSGALCENSSLEVQACLNDKTEVMDEFEPCWTEISCPVPEPKKVMDHHGPKDGLAGTVKKAVNKAADWLSNKLPDWLRPKRQADRFEELAATLFDSAEVGAEERSCFAQNLQHNRLSYCAMTVSQMCDARKMCLINVTKTVENKLKSCYDSYKSDSRCAASIILSEAMQSKHKFLKDHLCGCTLKVAQNSAKACLIDEEHWEDLDCDDLADALGAPPPPKDISDPDPIAEPEPVAILWNKLGKPMMRNLTALPFAPKEKLPHMPWEYGGGFGLYSKGDYATTGKNEDYDFDYGDYYDYNYYYNWGNETDYYYYYYEWPEFLTRTDFEGHVQDILETLIAFGEEIERRENQRLSNGTMDMEPLSYCYREEDKAARKCFEDTMKGYIQKVEDCRKKCAEV